MAGGGGPHNKSPRWGSGLLGGGWGVVFADWNAPALGRILDQQGVGNVGNSTMYQLRKVGFTKFSIALENAQLAIANALVQLAIIFMLFGQ
jgi:hypothetical protein